MIGNCTLSYKNASQGCKASVALVMHRPQWNEEVHSVQGKMVAEHSFSSPGKKNASQESSHVFIILLKGSYVSSSAERQGLCICLYMPEYLFLADL